MTLRPTSTILLLSLVAAAPLRAGDSTPGFDPANLDRSADPCVDFYQFSCGAWMANNPVPADQSRWGRFNVLQERNRNTLRTLLEKAAGSADPLDARIGGYYAACMDEAAIEKKGVAPLQAQLARIDGLKDKAQIPALLAHLHATGARPLFALGSQQDFKDSTRVLADIDQSGLGMPDRDYYLKDDADKTRVRKEYASHVERMFTLAGDPAPAAAAHAQQVLQIETALAKAALDRVSRRDPAKVYHMLSLAELKTLAPNFDWKQYFAAAGTPAFGELNVSVPDFFKGMDALLVATPLAAWKTYLRWHVLSASAALLPAAFVAEDFAFGGKVLQGAKELRPRWKRCVDAVDDALGEALGQRFVEATFGAEGKARMSRMVAGLERALERDIHDLPWMTETTRKQAAAKLAAIANKIGHPERWRDYSTIAIERGDALGNAERARAFETRRVLAKIGRPVDRQEWGMSPPTVNAYYNPLMNDINFPAGILQPPFYDNAMDDAVNYGAIGAVIGHELTHGFDDTGRKFGPTGNMADWWTEADAREFEARAGCVADQYSGYTAVADVKLNGKLTLGENVADNGGLRIAHMALLETLGTAARSARDGFTPEQRFFLGWGQIWCQNRTDESARLLAQIDSHSPGRYRVNGVVANMPEFQQAFACPATAPMVREKPCRVW